MGEKAFEKSINKEPWSSVAEKRFKDLATDGHSQKYYWVLFVGFITNLQPVSSFIRRFQAMFTDNGNNQKLSWFTPKGVQV
ncbi:MAG: hypothetical protein H7X83_05990 [Verrucomicrobia bacterium]|nr:hypothetical protein [Deltaproteobacteria bacterium]